MTGHQLTSPLAYGPTSEPSVPALLVAAYHLACEDNARVEPGSTSLSLGKVTQGVQRLATRWWHLLNEEKKVMPAGKLLERCKHKREKPSPHIVERVLSVFTGSAMASAFAKSEKASLLTARAPTTANADGSSTETCGMDTLFMPHAKKIRSCTLDRWKLALITMLTSGPNSVMGVKGLAWSHV